MCYWKKKQEGFRSSVKSGRPFCEKVFFQCSPAPLYTHIYTHTHTHKVYTSSMGFRFDFFWTPARPRHHRATPSTPPPHTDPPVPHRQTPYRPAHRMTRAIVLFTASPAGSGEPSALRVYLCVCVFACESSGARGDEAAGRPCSHTGSVDGSSSVFRWSSCCVYVSSTFRRSVNVSCTNYHFMHL